MVVQEISQDECRLLVDECFKRDTEEQYRKTLSQLASSAHRTVIVDLTALDNLNSATIARLFWLRMKLLEKGRRLRVEGCTDTVFGILESLRMDAMMPVFRQT